MAILSILDDKVRLRHNMRGGGTRRHWISVFGSVFICVCVQMCVQSGVPRVLAVQVS